MHTGPNKIFFSKQATGILLSIAKWGDNVLGSVRPSISPFVCRSACLSVCLSITLPTPFSKEYMGSHYQSEVFVCVSVIRGVCR